MEGMKTSDKEIPGRGKSKKALSVWQNDGHPSKWGEPGMDEGMEHRRHSEWEETCNSLEMENLCMGPWEAPYRYIFKHILERKV